MNVLPGMAYRCRADGTMELVSDGASELTGYSPGEWSADRAVTFETLVQPEDLPNIRAKRLEAFTKKQHFRAEYRILTKSGAIKWVWDQAHGVYVNDRVVAIAGFMTDITERKRLESDLVQSQKMESVGRLAGASRTTSTISSRRSWDTPSSRVGPWGPIRPRANIWIS